MKRRNFLAATTGVALLTAIKPAFSAGSGQKTLMVVELVGANDGLNTFIPYTDQNYFQLRPTIALQNGIKITGKVALNPAMESFKPLFEADQLAIIQNVSYPNPSLSHFRSRDIWYSAQPQGTPYSGWLARYLTSIRAATGDAVFLGDEYPLTLIGEAGERYLQLAPGLSVQLSTPFNKAVLSLYDVRQNDPDVEELRQTVVKNRQAIDQLAQQPASQTVYPDNEIGKRFALASKILKSQPKVLYVTVGGWDTHTDQLNRQGNLLRAVTQSLAAIQRDLRDWGLQDHVLTMVHSEFGRRPAENGTKGTDHGTNGPVILLGNQVRAGLYGGQPPLDSLVNGNLPLVIDFRRIYAEVLSKWLATDPQIALGQNFAPIGCL